MGVAAERREGNYRASENLEGKGSGCISAVVEFAELRAITQLKSEKAAGAFAAAFVNSVSASTRIFLRNRWSLRAGLSKRSFYL